MDMEQFNKAQEIKRDLDNARMFLQKVADIEVTSITIVTSRGNGIGSPPKFDKFLGKLMKRLALREVNRLEDEFKKI